MSNNARQLDNEIFSDTPNQEWVVSLQARFDNQLGNTPNQSLQTTEEKPSIFSDTPYVVAFEHTINSLHETTCTAWQFVAFMTRWFDLDVPSYFEYIEKKEHLDRVWGYYTELAPRYRDGERKLFLYYLLFNSCIIIFVILSFQTVQNPNKIFCTGPKIKWSDPRDQQSFMDQFHILYQHITSDNPRSVKCGMLDMDRQIPWFVVEAVYTEHSNLMKDVGIPITDLALSCFGDLYPGVHLSKVKGDTLPPGGFKHLLHMFHWSRTPEEKYLVETRSLQPIESMDSFYIPSATDLQLSATVFKKHAGIHVSYRNRRLSGVMQLAPLHIFKYSRETYSHLLRFERGYVNCGFPVTAYIACMVCLLQKEADVKLLRANEIIPRTWNDDRDVLSFVQNFKSTVLPINFQLNGLNTLSEEVMKHHKKRISRYYAFLKTRYCPNPWIIISVIAAVCLFVLTLLQTIYTMRG